MRRRPREQWLPCHHKCQASLCCPTTCVLKGLAACCRTHLTPLYMQALPVPDLILPPAMGVQEVTWQLGEPCSGSYSCALGPQALALTSSLVTRQACHTMVPAIILSSLCLPPGSANFHCKGPHSCHIFFFIFCKLQKYKNHS